MTKKGWVQSIGIGENGQTTYEGPCKGWDGALKLGIGALTFDVPIDEEPYATSNGTMVMVLAGVPLERTGSAPDIMPDEFKGELDDDGPLQKVDPVLDEDKAAQQRELERTQRELQRIQERIDEQGAGGQ